MRRTLFKKYFAMTMVIVLTSYILLGSAMMLFNYNYWREEKKALLTHNVSSIASFAGEFTVYLGEGNNYGIQAESLGAFMNIISENVNADIFITDTSGNILMGVYSNSKITSAEKIDPSFVQNTVSGFFETRSKFDGMYSTSYYAIGMPFLVEKDDGVQQLAGAIFAATSDTFYRQYLMSTLDIFIIASAVTLTISFIVVWLFTYKMIKPLRQIATAARSFGSGDFSVRVPVKTEDEVGQLAIAINNMANSLSNSEGMRRSFIANVSHELKTPMTTIAGFIDGILDGTIPYDKEGYYLRIVSSEVKRLSRLVKSMLDLSKIDNGEMKLNPVKFDLSDTVLSTLLTFEHSIEEKNIDIQGLESISPLQVTGDKDLIHQVIYNLIENAVKFTNDGGYIRIALSDSIDKAYVSIENSGLGIPKDDVPMIFERFYKTDKSRSRDKNGMGLGLYLVKMILQLHGGNISVTSQENAFCRFSFYLPKPIANAKNIENTQKLKLSEKDKDNNIQDVE